MNAQPSTRTKPQPVPTQVYKVYIQATPQAIWDAITQPEWALRYGYHSPVDYDLRAGGRYRGLASPQMLERCAPEVIIEGEVLECDPPHKLVQTWHPLWDPVIASDAPSRLTWEIADEGEGVCALTVTHELEGAPETARQVRGRGKFNEGGGGWPWVLSDMKSLLERGKGMG